MDKWIPCGNIKCYNYDRKCKSRCREGYPIPPTAHPICHVFEPLKEKEPHPSTISMEGNQAY